jgi:hypothetical protein
MADRAEIIESLQSDFGFPLEKATLIYEMFTVNTELHGDLIASIGQGRAYPAAELLRENYLAAQMHRYHLFPDATGAHKAVVVEDYPFGFNLRCRCRYWIETAQNGSKKGQQRMCKQTSHKSFNIHYTEMTPDERLKYETTNLQWNKPKCSGYSDMVLLYRDNTPAGKGYIECWHISKFLSPENFYIARDMFGNPLYQNVQGEEVYAAPSECQMSHRQQKDFLDLERLSRKLDPSKWKEFLIKNNGNAYTYNPAKSGPQDQPGPEHTSDIVYG